ncbi:MAG: hypothetical protein MUW51_09910 [Lactococcus lactis]|nr:hypothetical protein [Lactococcus lactis]
MIAFATLILALNNKDKNNVQL